jgi:hypothetical protein
MNACIANGECEQRSNGSYGEEDQLGLRGNL